MNVSEPTASQRDAVDRNASDGKVPDVKAADAKAPDAKAADRDAVQLHAAEGATAPLDAHTLAWDKQNGLLPAIVQDANTLAVLMLGYMSPEALRARTVRTWVRIRFPDTPRLRRAAGIS